MARSSDRRWRNMLCCGLASAMGAWLACEAPDGSVLYEPLPAGGAGGAAAGAPPLGGASAGGAEVGLAGAAGSAGAASGAGAGGSGAAPVAGGAGGNAGDDGAGAIGDAGVADAGPGAPPCVARPAELCDGLDNDCDGRVDEDQACLEGCAGFALSEHGYMFCPEPVDRGVALARCEARGLKLAWVEDAAENAALVLSIAALEPEADDDELITQIGASDSGDEGEWRWVGNGASPDGFPFWEGGSVEEDGEVVGGAYQNWAEVEPNDQDGEDCGVLSVLGSQNRDPGQWDDRNCDDEFAFVCEAP